MKINFVTIVSPPSLFIRNFASARNILNLKTSFKKLHTRGFTYKLGMRESGEFFIFIFKEIITISHHIIITRICKLLCTYNNRMYRHKIVPRRTGSSPRDESGASVAEAECGDRLKSGMWFVLFCFPIVKDHLAMPPENSLRQVPKMANLHGTGDS